MSSTHNNPPSTPADQRLARLCLDQVAREQLQLDATLIALDDIRTALLSKDHAALTAALAQHESTIGGSEETCRARVAFQQEAGALLGVPAPTITLDLLISRLPGEVAGIVADARTRLRQQAAAVERLNNSNASLLYHCLDFLQRFFDRATGRPCDGRYGPAGKRTAVSGCSLIDARG
jgi:hypothetical protein